MLVKAVRPQQSQIQTLAPMPPQAPEIPTETAPTKDKLTIKNYRHTANEKVKDTSMEEFTFEELHITEKHVKILN